MDFALSDEQTTLVEAVQSILEDHAELSQSERHSYFHYDQRLQDALTDNGFLDVGRQIGSVEAVLVIIEAARLPAVVEVAGTALIAAKLMPERSVDGPVAVIAAPGFAKAHRNLPIARTLFVEHGADVVVLPSDAVQVEAVENSIYAYPYGRFVEPPDLSAGEKLIGMANRLRHWSRVALAAEVTGAGQSALAFTIDHVKQRHVFGRAVGSFQAVQHRLAQCHFVLQGLQYLTLRAAWSGSPEHADQAACYAQQHIRKIVVDLHQFNGAMGVTNEHLLHYWTYRLRALQSEAGGADGSALALASLHWGEAGSVANAACTAS